MNTELPTGRMPRSQPLPIADFRVLRTLNTRWMDNDAYGHVNNVVYYSWFDTAVNAWLVEQGALDVAHSSSIALVVNTECHYFAPLTFPQQVRVGLRLLRLGRSSVEYGLGVFGSSDMSAACGRFVHVYVDRTTRRPIPLAPQLINLLETLR